MISTYKTNPGLQQVLLQNMTSAQVQPGQVRDSLQLLNSVAQARAGYSTISANGARLNNIGRTLRESAGQKAYEGFQSAIRQSVDSADSLKSVRLINSIDIAVSGNVEATGELFAGMAELSGEKEAGLFENFNSALTSVIEKAGVEGLPPFSEVFSKVAAVEDEDAGGSRSQNLAKLFSAVRAVSREAASGEEAVSNLKHLAEGVEISKQSRELWTYFDDFIGPDPT